MAKITKVNTKRSAFSAAAFAAANPSAAVETGADDRMVLLVRNTAEAAKTLTVKAGTALQESRTSRSARARVHSGRDPAAGERKIRAGIGRKRRLYPRGGGGGRRACLRHSPPDT